MYTPSSLILERYADVLVNFALNSGQWIKPWEVVALYVPECAKPLLEQLYIAVLKAWWHPIVRYSPDWFQKIFFDHASWDQIQYAPRTALLWEVDAINHRIGILAEFDKYELKDINPSHIMQRQRAMKFFKDAIFAKEDQGNLTRSLAMYGTESMASDVDMSLEEYRHQIIIACFLDDTDPISRRRETFTLIEGTRAKLNNLSIEWLYVQWEDVDLKIKIWANRQWLWGSGRNIPSFELFISPDWRGTNWRIRFNQPLYREWSVMKGIELKFEDGIITNSSATHWEELLKEMISVEHANKIGEYSLTDRRTSKVTRVMWETLYDENIGWPFGNTHLAIGSAYKESFRWDVKNITKEQWLELWFNDSAVHTDIISTTDRTVTALLTDWSQIIIYQWGEFII